MSIAHSRSTAFTVGLSEADVRHLLWMTRRLTERAAILFAHVSVLASMRSMMVMLSLPTVKLCGAELSHRSRSAKSPAVS